MTQRRVFPAISRMVRPVLFLFASCVGVWALDAPEPTQSPSPPAAAAANGGAAQTKPYEIEGFRSAMFGATEAEVRAAAIKDFGVGADAIHATQNLAERTKILSVRVPNVLPEGGVAEVAYTLGFKTGKLIQVSVSWSNKTDDKLTAERLLQDGESLRQYFEGYAYAPGSVVLNSPVKGGVLLFRGADAKGRTTVLMLEGSAASEGGKTRFAPSALALVYLADPKEPDIYRIPPGKF